MRKLLPDSTLAQVPPHSVEAEQAVLGSMIQDRHAIARAVEILHAEDFYEECHRRIYQTMIDLYERDEPVDLITVTDRLKTRGHLEDVGGAVYITSLLDAVPSAANVEYSARLVRRDAVKRHLIDLAAEVGHAARNGYDPEELLAVAGRMVSNLSERLDSIHSPHREGTRKNRISASALADEAASEVIWLPFLRMEGVVGRGIATLLSSHGKQGKTTTLVHSVRGLTPVKVVWLTEEPRSLWSKRVRQYPELASPDLTLIFASGRAWSNVLGDLEREEADLLIIDTIRGVCGIVDENDQAAVTAAIQPLIYLVRRKGSALILVHHLRKSAAEVGLGHAGSHALVGLVDVAVELHRDQHSPSRRVCRAVSRFEETPAEWLLEMRDHDLHVLGNRRVVRAADLAERVAAVLGDEPRTRKEVANLLAPRPSSGALQAALDAVVQSRKAVRGGEGKRGDPHRWTRADNSIHSRTHSIA
ncbi:MAG: DnaB-like helicase N-terminal domain-containing protein [bacterium]